MVIKNLSNYEGVWVHIGLVQSENPVIMAIYTIDSSEIHLRSWCNHIYHLFEIFISIALAYLLPVSVNVVECRNVICLLHRKEFTVYILPLKIK